VGRRFGIGMAAAELTGVAMADLVRLSVIPSLVMDIPPRSLRQAFLTFRSAIQGRIPEILGDDEEERIETLAALLEGTSEEDLNTLLVAASEALSRLEAAERRRHARRERSDRRRERGRSAA